MSAEARIDTEWSLAGQPAVIMESRLIKVVVLSDLDEPEVLGGELMPDHGELWSMPWTPLVGVDDDHVWLNCGSPGR